MPQLKYISVYKFSQFSFLVFLYVVTVVNEWEHDKASKALSMYSNWVR